MRRVVEGRLPRDQSEEVERHDSQQSHRYDSPDAASSTSREWDKGKEEQRHRQLGILLDGERHHRIHGARGTQRADHRRPHEVFVHIGHVGGEDARREIEGVELLVAQSVLRGREIEPLRRRTGRTTLARSCYKRCARTAGGRRCSAG